MSSTVGQSRAAMWLLVSALALAACGGSARIRPIAAWSEIEADAANAGWFTITRGGQTVVLYCTADPSNNAGPLTCDAHVVGLSGRDGDSVTSFGVDPGRDR